MRRLMMVLSTFVVASLAVPGAQQPAARPDPLIREGVTEKITDHVYVIPDGSVSLVPNVGIIVGSRATLVVDTGMGTRNGETVLREVAKVSRNRELYLATTHVHPEHDLGAGAFPPDTKMIRSKAQQDEIAESGLATVKTFAGFSPLNAQLLEGATFRKADISFDKEYNVDLGGVRVRLIAVGPAHTKGDTAFLVDPDAVLFAGDVAMSALPAVSAASSVRQWLADLDLFDSLRPRRIVPSHGPMGDLMFVANYRAFFTAIQERVRAAKASGKSLDETIPAVQNDLQGRYDRQRMTGAIRAAYAEAP
jgi:glyoxylase-like metal-dependent hydrolase (beta-lactamase superfamily II)